MSVRLDMEYTPELNDNTSSAYNSLTSRILPVVIIMLTPYSILKCTLKFLVLNITSLPQLVRQYKGITGFVGVFVRRFRYGNAGINKNL